MRLNGDVVGDLGDSAGLMAFAAVIKDEDRRREMEARSVKLFWATIYGASTTERLAPVRRLSGEC